MIAPGHGLSLRRIDYLMRRMESLVRRSAIERTAPFRARPRHMAWRFVFWPALAVSSPAVSMVPVYRGSFEPVLASAA